MCLIRNEKKRKRDIIIQQLLLILQWTQEKITAKEGVEILIHRKYEDCIEDIKYISERILTVRLNTENSKLNFLSIYAPENCKPLQHGELFYQDTVNSIPKAEHLIAGDFNARIGDRIIAGVKQRFNEDVLNENGEIMSSFCANELRINNTFFDHKPQQQSITA